MNVPVILMEKGNSAHPMLRGTNFMTKYRSPEGYDVIKNKESYMDDETW